MTECDSFNLKRFLDAQEPVFETVMLELESGSKESHWMWFIFPQLTDLGRSATAKFYGMRSANEARAYLDHPVLGPRLRASVAVLQRWAGARTAEEIMGPIDAIKLRSCLTLFDRLEPESIFFDGLVSFFGGYRDDLTLALLAREQ